MEKIGIIGSGAVGQALGNGFIKHGFSVMIGSRDTSKLEEWKSEVGKNASTGSFQEAASYGNTLVLATKGTVALDVLNRIGSGKLKGKTLIDATNPIADAPPENGVLRYFTEQNYSLMEELQKTFPDTNFVKAFNSIGSHFMVNPSFKEGKPTMFICGNNQQAKTEVSKILDLFGFEIEDMGEAEAARAIEPLAMLWCIPGFRENNWTHAFKLMKL